ncbi:AAA family ATPase [Egicoccus sp. AB-alg6-2]|uniref:AAA family ATPase n=1 Tax=Egicoccus sp. AB-alg6-2 TaxID=3242692 RepID=UPI00359D0261
MDTLSASAFARSVLDAAGTAVVGLDDQLELVVIGMLAGGHVLVEDVPGTGKTSAVRALAAVTGLPFGRLQCTPDLLPTEVTGVNVYDQATGEFRFRRGPVFRSLLLVDEINRATPRTQAALLEAMAERQVTVDGESHPLGREFTVIATQNPVEQAGTFPLPEAQMDRFLLRVSFGYPTRDAHRDILRGRRGAEPLEHLSPVVAAMDALPGLWDEVGRVHVDPSVEDYVLDLVDGLRGHEEIAVGPSVRAVLMLEQAARATAAVAGRDHVLPDDVKRLAVPLLAHRLVLHEDAGVHGRDPDTLVAEVLAGTRVPVQLDR